METFDNDGLRFDVSDTGPADGRAVILLHGFPNDRSAWDEIAPRLVAAGHRVVVPDQRGYSAGARPRRRRDYRLSRLVGDVLALADRAGVETFDLVGHDWGAVVGYAVAARHPSRVRTLTAVSAPHPGAWARSMISSVQAARSAYMIFFQMPFLPERLLRARLRRMLTGSGLDARHADRYAARATGPGGLTGPLHWYRAIPLERHRVPRVPVSTVLVHGTGDRFVTRAAADLCRRWITGPYRLEVWDGVSHWIPEQEPARLSALILTHLRSAA
jgi:pimeloyl-ACP methyl ester carboxylesterase